MSSFIDKLKTQLGGYFAKEEDLATVATTGDYTDLINAPQGGGGGSSEEKPPIILRFTKEQLDAYLALHIPPSKEEQMNQVTEQILSNPEYVEALSNPTKKDEAMSILIDASFYTPESTLTYYDFCLEVHSESNYMVKPYKIDIDRDKNPKVYSLFFKNLISVDESLYGYGVLSLANKQIESEPIVGGAVSLYSNQGNGVIKYTLEHDFTVNNTPGQTEV